MYEISHSSLFLVIRFKFSIMFNGINLQLVNVFILVFVICIPIEIIVIMSTNYRNFIIAQPYFLTVVVWEI